MPRRTCVGCRRVRPKPELIRLVRRAGGAVVRDPHGPGRGAYVCDDAACMDRALKGGRLAQAFRTPRETVGVATINDAVSGR
ncbi:MAG TPA: YlxR family protein [Methylomirabilota bacterium]|nr:YlxR family protein [Methylomirabilota bacterium]